MCLKPYSLSKHIKHTNMRLCSRVSFFCVNLIHLIFIHVYTTIVEHIHVHFCHQCYLLRDYHYHADFAPHLQQVDPAYIRVYMHVAPFLRVFWLPPQRNQQLKETIMQLRININRTSLPFKWLPTFIKKKKKHSNVHYADCIRQSSRSSWHGTAQLSFYIYTV